MLIIAGGIIIGLILLYKLLQNYMLSNAKERKFYESIAGEYFNNNSNTSVKIKHITDNIFYIEFLYNDNIIISTGSICLKMGFRGKRNTFSYKVNDNSLKILIKDKNSLYVEHKIKDIKDKPISFQGLYRAVI